MRAPLGRPQMVTLEDSIIARLNAQPAKNVSNKYAYIYTLASILAWAKKEFNAFCIGELFW